MKTCKRCNQNKIFSDFRVNVRNKDGYASYCTPCAKEYSKQWHRKTYQNKYAKEKTVGDTRICSICNDYKPFSDFKNEKYSWCNICQKEYDRKRNEKGLVRPRKYLDGKMHCRDCNEYLTKENFTIRKNTNTRCDPCQIVHQHRQTVKKHGIDYEQYLEMYEKQDGKCKICSNVETSYKSRLSIDHDHACCPGENSCGKCIRGLLCFKCNTALGNVKDDVNILQNMIRYLNNG